MKTKYLLISAFALVTLVACKREMVYNPDYDPETETVKTQVVFSVSTASNDTKQVADETQATSSSPFLGMNQAWMFAYQQKTGTSPNFTYQNGKILSSDQSTENIYDLDNLVGPGDLSQQTETSQTNKPSHRVLEMQLPIKTNTLLFYGRGRPGAVAATDPWDVYDHFGHMDAYTISGTVGEVDFRLGKRISDHQKFTQVEKVLAAIFTVIMNSNLKEATARTNVLADDFPTQFDITSDPEKAAMMKPYMYALNGVQTNVEAADYLPPITWADYIRADGKSPVTPAKNRTSLEGKLCTAFTQMTTIHTSDGELRAGSGETILLVMKDLWSVINSVRCSQPTGKEEAVAKLFAEVVSNNLYKYFSAIPPSDGGPVTSIAYQPFSTMRTNLATDLANADRWFVAPANSTVNIDLDVYKPDMDYVNNSSNFPTNYDLSKFPYVFKLPRGATHMACVQSVTVTPEGQEAYSVPVSCFYYPQTFNVDGMHVSPGTVYNADNYYYPAELLYFGNSPIRVRDEQLSESQYPNGSMTWNTESEWTAWSSGAEGYVRSSTRSVAMQYNINYGVALLETKVKIGAEHIYDNNAFIQDRDNHVTEDDKEVVINGTDKYFKLTGIIVGGQSQNVGWNYLPIDPPGWTTGQTKDGFIYDMVVPADSKVPAYGSTVPTTPSVYTVVFDNFYDSRASNLRVNAFSSSITEAQVTEIQQAQEVVSIALEFQNNAGDFYGNHNLIKHGDYFYLIGQVSPNAGSSMSWPTNYVLPPYKDDGTSLQIKRVFMQDCKTSITFSIGANSLKTAYLTVPDLRSTSLSLGLSVDLSWTPGLTFNDVVLGETVNN